MVEMVGNDMLAAAGDEDELLDSGLARLLDGILDHRLVHDRQHLLGDGLGGRQEAGPHAGNGENSLADGSGSGHVFFRRVFVGDGYETACFMAWARHYCPVSSI